MRASGAFGHERGPAARGARAEARRSALRLRATSPCARAWSPPPARRPGWLHAEALGALRRGAGGGRERLVKRSLGVLILSQYFHPEGATQTRARELARAFARAVTRHRDL
jgi:hypothetical protein